MAKSKGNNKKHANQPSWCNFECGDEKCLKNLKGKLENRQACVAFCKALPKLLSKFGGMQGLLDSCTPVAEANIIQPTTT